MPPPPLFHTIGRLLSTHQIASLLLSSFLICSLLAPSLLLYTSPHGPTSHIVIRGRGRLLWELEALKRQGVLASEDEVCWERLSTYYASTKRGRPRVVRMEQVLVTTAALAGYSRAGGSSTGSGALSKRTLHLAKLVQGELERRLLNGEVQGLTCVRDGERCASTSPADWWDTEEELLADEDVHRTLSRNKVLPPTNITDLSSSPTDPKRRGHLPLTPSSTLVGIGFDKSGKVKGAKYLTLTFFLEDTGNDSLGKGIGTIEEEMVRERGKIAWRDTVRDVVAGRGWIVPTPAGNEVDALGFVREGKGTGRRVILKHLPHLLVHSNPRLFEDFLFAVGYSLVILYVFLTVKKINHVHSKVGLVFTGFVELIASGIMSLSVCWLLGLSVSLVPWKLIPFIVIVSGIDNMFVLTQAIGSTDISLPVPERVAAGLASVGGSTTITLITELAFATLLLNAIDVQVIRQLIIFFAVVLVVDYFLEMSFFVTVLSIDIQRLELADLLQQGIASTSSPVDSSPFSPLSPTPSAHSLSSFLTYLKSGFHARIARSSTFAFLIFINLLLYSMYGPDHYLPAFCSETALAIERPLLGPSLSAEFSASLTRGRRGGIEHGLDEGSKIGKNAGVEFWRVINPSNASSVHVYVEPVALIKLFDDGLVAPESVLVDLAHDGAIVYTPVWVRIGMVLIPIAVALVVIYFILLYVLKDVEVLESRRRRAALEQLETEKLSRGAGVELIALRGRHEADVELIASGRDVVVSWAGLEAKIVVWQRRRGGTKEFEVAELGIPRKEDGVVSLKLLEVDGEDRFCAATDLGGNVFVWELDDRSLLEFSTTTTTTTTFGPATHLFAVPLPSRPAPGLQRRGFYSVHQNGHVVLWDCTSCTSSIVISPPSPSDGTGFKNFVVFPPKSPTTTSTSPSPSTTSTTSLPLYARIYSTGQLELFQCEGGSNWADWSLKLDSQITIPSDGVTALAFGNYSFGASSIKVTKGILVVATLSGLVSLFDLESGQRVTTVVEMTTGPVRQIRLEQATRVTCSSCSNPITDGVVVVCSTKSLVSVQRVFTPSSASSTGSNCLTCSPSAQHPLLDSSHSNSAPSRLRSASSSSHQSLLNSKKPRRTSQESLPYPPPMHGFHSRRSSANSDRPPKPTPPEGLSGPGSDGYSSSAVSSRSPSPLPGMRPTSGFGFSVTASIDPSTGRTTPPISSSSNSVPLFDTLAIDLMESDQVECLSASGWPNLHSIEMTAIWSDERGGWELIDRALVGVRRGRVARKGETEYEDARGPTSWEIWTLPLAEGTAGSSGVPATSALDGLLSLAGAAVVDAVPLPAANSAPLLSTSSSSSLRRRAVSSIPSPSPSSRLSSTTPTPTNALLPTIRFTNIDLAFSRARPIVPALGNIGIAVGLGNQVAVVTRREGEGGSGAVAKGLRINLQRPAGGGKGAGVGGW